MEEKRITSTGKVQKMKVGDINDGIRNICSLPETILEHILSFLPMKDAVRTSVLSKKWEFLWKSIPKLEFEEDHYPNRDVFMDSVDRMVLLRGCCSIKDFWLGCETIYSVSRINLWVAAVVRHNVEICTIQLFKTPKPFALPRCLFTCHTLTTLRLDIPCSLRFPSQIYLPNLKALGLQNIILLDEHSIQQLFSSPALEKLYVINCSWFYLKAITISSPKLKHLAIEEGDKRDPNQKTEYHCQVTICDCNLECFILSGVILVNEYSMSNLSVVDVIVGLENVIFAPFEAERHLKKILQDIPAVQRLYFSCVSLNDYKGARGSRFEELDFPIFSALHTLRLEDYFDIKSEVLGKILQRTPHLHTLQIFQTRGCPSRGEDCELFDSVPPCFFSSLKKIKVYRLFSEKGELRVLKTILKHAMVLEELVISPDSSLEGDGKWTKFCRVLRGYPRGSENCNIIIEDFDNSWFHFAGSFSYSEFPFF